MTWVLAVVAYFVVGTVLTYFAMFYILKWDQEANGWRDKMVMTGIGPLWVMGIVAWPLALPEMLLLSYFEFKHTPKSSPSVLTRRLERRLDDAGVFDERSKW